MLSLYRRSLGWFLDHRRITIVILVLVMGGTVVLLRLVPRGFIPSEDRAIVYGPTEAAEGISFEAMKRLQQALAEVVRQDPNVEAFMSNAGSRPGGIAGGNTGSLFLRLKPRHERELTADQVIQNLRPKLAQVPGIRAFLQNPPAISVGGRVTKSQYQYTLQGTDVDELYRIAPQVAAAIQALPGFLDVTTDLQLRNPQVNIDINRDKASSLGVSVEQIEDALYSAYGSRQISTIFADTNQYQVILELKPEYQRDAAALSLLYVRSSSGALVPLNVLARISQGYGPLTINHSGQLPSVTISFNLRPGFALGDAVAELNRMARGMLPATIIASFQGTAQVFESSIQNLGLLLVVAVLVIYIVLGILYESFIHPVTILSALPLAGLGALFTLYVFNAQLDIYSFVGLILLVGLVKKNGIIMVDFALELQRVERKSPREAIFEACIVRFRPIMMTTFAALVGTIPIAVGWGAGGESRQPLGLAVVGGLFFSQMLTLFVTPVFYLYMDGLQRRFRSRVRTVKVGGHGASHPARFPHEQASAAPTGTSRSHRIGTADSGQRESIGVRLRVSTPGGRAVRCAGAAAGAPARGSGAEEVVKATRMVTRRLEKSSGLAAFLSRRSAYPLTAAICRSRMPLSSSTRRAELARSVLRSQLLYPTRA